MQKYKEEERWQKAEVERLEREEQIFKDTIRQQKRREKGTANVTSNIPSHHNRNATLRRLQIGCSFSFKPSRFFFLF